jgi:hypothetical protein
MSNFACFRGRGRQCGALAFAIVLGVLSPPALAQQAAEPHDHSQHKMPAEDHSRHTMTPQGHSGHQPAAGTEKKSAPKTKTPAKHGGHHPSQGAMQHRSSIEQAAHSEHGGGAHDHGAQDQHGAHDEHGGMKGFLGPYSMTREGSGTSWVPDTSPHEGIHGKIGEWSTMWHGYLNLIYDRQGGPRGADKTFTNGMVMGMAQRPLGDGTLGVRAMLSPDPFMGKSGYPLLLASGATADGRTHLIDRQHHLHAVHAGRTVGRNRAARGCRGAEWTDLDGQ